MIGRSFINPREDLSKFSCFFFPRVRVHALQHDLSDRQFPSLVFIDRVSSSSFDQRLFILGVRYTRGAKEDLPSQWSLFQSETRRSISMEVDSCSRNHSTNYLMNGSHFRASLSCSTFADSSFSVPWRLTHRPIVVVRHSHSVKLLSSLWILLPIPALFRIQIRRPASRTVVIAAFTQFLVVV